VTSRFPRRPFLVRSRTARRSFLQLALLALLAAAGCKVDPRDPPDPCEGAVRCPPGTACDAQTGFCAPLARAEPPQDTGRFCAIRLTPDGRMVQIAAYASDVGDLELLSYPAGNPPAVRTTVDGARDRGLDPDVGQGADLAIAPDGTLHLAYYDADAGALRYARRDARGWSVTVVDDEDDAGRFASLALDGQGWPRVAYAAGRTDSARELRLARASSRGWSVERIDGDGVGRYASLVLVGDAERIAYYDESRAPSDDDEETESQPRRQLKLAARGAGGWGLSVVDDGQWTDPTAARLEPLKLDVGRWASAAADPSGRLAIAYHDATRGLLLLAHTDAERRVIAAADREERDGTTFLELVDGAPDGHLVGQFASLVFDAAGRLRIVYQDSTTLDLRGAWREAVTEADGTRRWTWRTSVLASDGPVGFWARQAPGTASGETFVCHYRPARSADGAPRGSLEWLQWPLPR